MRHDVSYGYKKLFALAVLYHVHSQRDDKNALAIFKLLATT
jgi:hypothetical protein